MVQEICGEAMAPLVQMGTKATTVRAPGGICPREGRKTGRFFREYTNPTYYEDTFENYLQNQNSLL